MRTMVILLSGDAILAIAAFSTGFLLRFGTLPEGADLAAASGVPVIVFVAALLFSSFIVETYNMEKTGSEKEVLIRAFLAVVLSFFLLSSFYFVMPSSVFNRGMLMLALTVFYVYQSLWHISFRLTRTLPGIARRILIIGTGPLAKKVGSIVASTDHTYVLSGYVNCAREALYVPTDYVVGNGDGLVETAKKERAHKLVISLSERRGVAPVRDLLNCKLNGIEVIDAPSFYEQVTGKLLIENITPSWFIFSDGFRITQFKRFYKNLFDVTLAVFVLWLCLPLFALIIPLIKLDSRGPVFFKQRRVGENESTFLLYKFRTMRHDAESATGPVWAQENDPRITRVGRFLRKTRIDELPQFYNVLNGTMSIVGPRPERPEFVQKLKDIIPYYSERHVIKPGITGWAQIKYAYGASVEDAIEKLRYDLFYIKHLSLFMDILIFFETIKVVLFGRGGR